MHPRLVHACLIVMVSPGCGGVDDKPPSLPGLEPPPCPVESDAYLVDRIDLPGSGVEANSLGFDLTGDERSDNALAALMMWTLSEGLSAEPALEAAALSGNLLLVIVLERCAGEKEGWTRISLHQGTDRVFDGSETSVSIVPNDDVVGAVGEVRAGVVSVRRGVAWFPTSALTDTTAVAAAVWAEGAELTIELQQTKGTVDGRLGIGIHVDDARTAAATGLSRSLTAVVTADPGCPAACENKAAARYVSFFDADLDGVITAAEVLAQDAFVSVWLVPDLDLWALDDSARVFWPNKDGDLDAMSLGVGVHASGARLR